jgi:hypothetical protein
MTFVLPFPTCSGTMSEEQQRAARQVGTSAADAFSMACGWATRNGSGIMGKEHK